MFPEPHIAHPYVNTGLMRQSKVQKYDLEKQLGEMKGAYKKKIKINKNNKKLVIQRILLLMFKHNIGIVPKPIASLFTKKK